MKKIISSLLLMTVTATMITQNGTYAFAAGSSATADGNAAGQLGKIADDTSAVQSFQADLFTGRAQTGVPIFVPPGRKNVQPNLSLNYSSSSGNGWLGMGWGMDIGYIARDTKKGVPKYDSSDKFVFSYQGVNSELVEVDTDEYRAKDEALFLKFIFDSSNNKWIVTDKSGTVHTFGNSSGTRQAGGSGTFKWALAKVQDTSSNYMTVSYTTNNGELYLSTIEYNGNEGESFAHSHKVEFTLEDRDDDTFSYITGAKISTIKRLDNIQVKVKDGGGTYQLARKYVLDYAYSAATGRSRLTTVTEYGTDGSTSLPATTFVYQDKDMSFDSMANFTGIERASGVDDYDFMRSVTTSAETLTDFIDVNGDGKSDRVEAVSTNTAWKVQLNTGTSFASMTNFGTLHKPSGAGAYDWISMTTAGKEQITEFSDINGDGIPDRIISQEGGDWRVQTGTGTGLNTYATWGTIQRKASGDVHYDHIRYTPGFSPSGSTTLVDFFDINGDSLPDRVMAQEDDDEWKVQLNTGSGFASMITWGTTERMTSGSGAEHRDAIRAYTNSHEAMVDMVDLNGDGLPDRVQATDNVDWKVQWNTGSGFTTMETFGPIEDADNNASRYYIRHYTGSGEQTTDLFDINGDGLPDRVQATDDNTNWEVQYNTGTGFTSLENYGTVGFMTASARYSYPRWTDSSGGQSCDMADIDGDGLPDRIQATSSNTAWKKQKNKGPFPDLLSEVKNGRGGKAVITYTPSTQYDNTDTNSKERLPFPVQLVSQIVQHDGMGNTYTTTYSYKGGMYDATNREFRGFREVTVTDAVGTKVISTFGQTDLLKGKILKKEIKDSSNNLFSKEETTWDDEQPFTGVNFVFAQQVDSYIYDGDLTYKQTRKEFTYDDYGNIESTIERGDTGVSGDERKTINEYVYNTTDYIVHTPKKITQYDSDLTTIKSEKYFYYDGAASISTSPTAGLLTKYEEWLSTASGCSTAGTCTNNPKITLTYDDFGNVETVTDARSYTTTNTYDSTYHLFLIEIENALSQTLEFSYDPWLAKVLTSTDQNGEITEMIYDVLGRVSKVVSALDDSSEPTQEFAYDYPNLGSCSTTCVTRVTIKIKSSVPGDTFTQLSMYSFIDGLGRKIQWRSPAEDGGQQIVSGNITFNSRGLIYQQYAPYFATTSTSYVAIDTSKPKAQFTYDAIGRRVRIDYPDSTNSQVVFSDFVTTATDRRSKQLRYTNDAYDRLVKVEEFNSASTYTTTYEYDILNNLKKTTDNASNETVISYDSLSRKTGMVDPDMGTWVYTYDLNDNLITQVDAKSQTIEFTYDELNRVELKDLPGGETDVTYVYDTEPSTLDDTDVPGDVSYRVGRLTQVTDASGTHAFAYDEQGRVIMDRKTVDATPYDFVHTYDSMGRVRTLTYPDSEVVTYTYNGFGDIETISGVKSAVTTDYINDTDYNASGQITHTEYGNDVKSDYSYDADTLRLENIVTKKPDNTTKLQDLTYAFDNNGNVATIADTLNSMSQSFAYDDLNRLTQAVGSAYGTQNFVYDSIGNMTTKASRIMAYGAGAPGPHAVTSVTWSSNNYPTFCRDLGSGSCTLSYDDNGNMTTRGQDALSYDSENRLKEIKTREGVDGSTNYTLKAGWNVISFTHLPDDKSISSILTSLTFGTDYNQVSYWDSGSSAWKHWVNDPDFNDFSNFEYGKTYEIYNNSGSDKSLTVTGKTKATDITHNIVAGDNFISPSVKSAVNITTVLSSLTFNTDYSDVKRFNAATQLWESFANSDFTQFEPGKGYNIIGLGSHSFSYGKTEVTTTFVYDSTGARVKKITDGTTTTYLGKDYDVTGGVSTKYIFLADRIIASKNSSDVTLYYHEDHINSSNIITDASGDQAAVYEYDPYGATVTYTGSAEVKNQFTGQEKDDLAKLYNYNARLYDMQLGRFITADWVIQSEGDPQSFNRFSYARNNPIRFTDPTGNRFSDFFEAFDIDGRDNSNSNQGSSSSSGAFGDYNLSFSFSFSRSPKENQKSSTVNEAVKPNPVIGPSQQISPLKQYGTLGIMAAGVGNLDSSRERVNYRSDQTIIMVVGATVGIVLILTYTLGAPLVSGASGTVSDGAVGYRSHQAFKYAVGRAHPGFEWHHLVEQHAANVARFGAANIHNLRNMVTLPVAAHRIISNYYSTRFAELGNMTFRQWVSQFPYSFQYQEGQKIVNEVLKYLKVENI